MNNKRIRYLIITLVVTTILLFWPREMMLEAQIDSIAVGKLDSFVRSQMLNPQGGMKTTFRDRPYEKNNPITAGHTVLSESQGLLLEYARLINDQMLFLSTFDFLANYLQLPNGQYRWRISGTLDSQETFTATIDDLQIVQQLILAKKQWPELATRLTPAIDAYATTFFNDTTNNGFLINGFDYENNTKTNNLFLSYIDFSALQLIRSELGFAQKIQLDDLRKQSLAVVEQSYIADRFPFYHQQFFVDSLLLEQQPEINMIESMLVVKHLAEVNQIKPQTIQWLEENIATNIYAYYDNAGNPSTTRQSSAVYALVAQVAAELNNRELYEKAIAKIWQFQIQNPGTELTGALGDAETQTVIAYDQLQTLIASAKIRPSEEVNNEKTTQ